jgi:transposase
MNATTVAVDLAKSVFELAVADDTWHVIETHRLTRTQFERWFANRHVSLVIMEACGSAHHWARWLTSLGIEVQAAAGRNTCAPTSSATRPMQRTPRRCWKQSAASDIRPVRVKSVEQQALQGLHRIRSLWMGTRTSRINALRGFCREFGIAIPVGARPASRQSAGCWPIRQTAVPDLIRGTARLLMEEIRLLEARIAQLERELTAWPDRARPARRCCRSPASGCSRPPPWWPPPRVT